MRYLPCSRSSLHSFGEHMNEVVHRACIPELVCGQRFSEYLLVGWSSELTFTCHLL